MGRIVAIAGVPHNPFLPRNLAREQPSVYDIETARRFDEFRQRLEGAQPDRIVIIGSDHVRQWFMDNMPAFLVGKAESIPGVFPDEIDAYGLRPTRFRGDADMAGAILGGAQLDSSAIDFSFSNEFGLDHAFVVPLHFLDPSGAYPITPVFTNGVAPPLPRAERFVTLGTHLFNVLTSDAVDGRIAVVVSGHLSIEVGGPKFGARGGYDRTFDERATAWIGDGDIDAILKECTLARLLSAGNVTYQYLNFVSAMAVARFQKAAVATWQETAGESLPFFWWDEVRSNA